MFVAISRRMLRGTGRKPLNFLSHSPASVLGSQGSRSFAVKRKPKADPEANSDAVDGVGLFPRIACRIRFVLIHGYLMAGRSTALKAVLAQIESRFGKGAFSRENGAFPLHAPLQAPRKLFR